MTTSREKLVDCGICSQKMLESEQYLLNANCDHMFCLNCAKYGHITICPFCDQKEVIKQVKKRIRRPPIEYSPNCLNSREVANNRDSINDSIEVITNLYVITISGKAISLVPPYGAKTRVCRITEMIETLEGIKSGQQFLTYDDQPLDSINTLDFYNISDGSVVCMSKTLYVYCPHCTSITLTYYSHLNYGSLNRCTVCSEVLAKSSVCARDADPNSILPDIVSVNAVPNTEHDNVSVLEVSNNNPNHAKDKKIKNLFVKTDSGKVIPLTSLPFGKKTSIMQIKRMIESKIGIKPNQQLLSYQNRYLQDMRTLEFYNITEGSIISLSKQMRRFNCFNICEIFISCIGIQTCN